MKMQRKATHEQNQDQWHFKVSSVLDSRTWRLSMLCSNLFFKKNSTFSNHSTSVVFTSLFGFSHGNANLSLISNCEMKHRFLALINGRQNCYAIPPVLRIQCFLCDSIALSPHFLRHLPRITLLFYLKANKAQWFNSDSDQTAWVHIQLYVKLEELCDSSMPQFTHPHK